MPKTTPYHRARIWRLNNQGDKVLDRTKRILLAEDSRFLRTAYEYVLRKAGIFVSSAMDGEQALDMARNGSFDLIILDMLLPKLSGVEVLKTLKQDRRTSSIPVVVLSGLSQNNGSTLTQAGATAYYEKTRVAPEDLEQIVESALSGSPPRDPAPRDSQQSPVAPSSVRTREMEGANL